MQHGPLHIHSALLRDSLDDQLPPPQPLVPLSSERRRRQKPVLRPMLPDKARLNSIYICVEG
jgi:hypothetical protein